MLCMRSICKDEKASVLWSAARNEERPSSRGYTAYHPLVNHSPFSLIRLSSTAGTSRTVVFRSGSRTREVVPRTRRSAPPPRWLALPRPVPRLVSLRSAQPGLAQCRSAVPHPVPLYPARGMSGFGMRQVYIATWLNEI